MNQERYSSHDSQGGMELTEKRDSFDWESYVLREFESSLAVEEEPSEEHDRDDERGRQRQGHLEVGSDARDEVAWKKSFLEGNRGRL